VDTAARVLSAARTGGWTIAHAGLDLRHDPDYALFNGGEGVSGLRAAIPKAGTWTGDGARFVEPFVPRAGEFQAVGRSGASVLKNATLDPFLRNRGITTVLLMGFATHVCVESTLREAHDLGYNAVLVHDACAAFEQRQHDHVRRHVLHHFGTEIGAALLERIFAEG
jgi:nicotinamidase-related amidase